MTSIFLAALTLAASALAQPSSPPLAPLMTRWAAEVSPDHCLPEYPRPQLVRERWRNLNGRWQFQQGTSALRADSPGEKPPFNIDLPQTILVPFPIESALSGVMQRHDRAWYRRTFDIPADWRTNQQRILLHFGAVNWESTVHVNGQEVAHHRGGYDPFSIDITAALASGTQQEVIVGVFNPADAGDQPRGKQVNKPEGIWYTPSTGIWQTVWLEPVPEHRIDGLTIVPDLDSGHVLIDLDWSKLPADGLLEATALSGRHTAGLALGNSDQHAALDIKLDEPHPWTPDDPFLYDLHIKLIDGAGAILDEVTSYCALRKIALGKDDEGRTTIALNGQPIFQVGPLDQGFWPDGLYTAPTDEALKSDLEIMKRLGFNMVRKHVKVEPERWYYWADKLGLLVWQDMPSANNKTPEGKEQFQRELDALIQTHQNHPSIIMWVVFNEGWGQHDTARLVAHVKDLDPTRLVSSASGWTDEKTGDILDIHAYPGPGSPDPQADRAIVLGEFGGLGLGVDGHTWASKNWGYQGMKDKDELTTRYEDLLRQVHALKVQKGLCAAVYTQITDVETECNGVLTYDREVLKLDEARVRAANLGQATDKPK
jgi:beta-galactosidase/beta-glucuronidase